MHTNTQTHEYKNKETNTQADTNKYTNTQTHKFTAVEKVVACALVTQRDRVPSPVGTSFLGEVFSGFFLTCQTNVRKL